METTEATAQIIQKLESWGEAIITNIPNIAVALIVLVLSYFISRGVYRLTTKIAYKYIKQTSVVLLIARMASIVVVSLGLFLALGALNLGQALTTILSAAGISGLVIGLALQGSLSNLFSGVVLAFRKNIKIGNWVETNGFSGEVTDINLNYFVMKEADNNTVIIPNKTIIENPIKNYSLTTKMRISITCGVGYESDLDKVEKLTKETINSNFNQESIGKEMEFYYTDFGDSSINFVTRFWVDAQSGLEKLRAKSTAIKEIKKAFVQNDINIPFPIRTLKFGNPTKEELFNEELMGVN